MRKIGNDGYAFYSGQFSKAKSVCSSFKDDCRQVRTGMECGINIANFNDVKRGDIIEAFATERVAAEMRVA